MNTLTIRRTWDNGHLADDCPMIEVELRYNDESPRRVIYELYRSLNEWDYISGDNEPIMDDEVTRIWHSHVGDIYLTELYKHSHHSFKIEA